VAVARCDPYYARRDLPARPADRRFLNVTGKMPLAVSWDTVPPRPETESTAEGGRVNFFDRRWYRWPRSAVRISREYGLRTLFMVTFRVLFQIVGANLFPRCAFRRSEYEIWIRRYERMGRRTRQALRNEMEQWVMRPRISLLLCVSRCELHCLRTAVRSVERQIYPKWDLCVALTSSAPQETISYLRRSAIDEPRIRIATGELPESDSDALNCALSLASGDLVGIMEVNAALSEDALYWAAKQIVLRPDMDLIFCDEDRVDGKGRRLDPAFKSNWNPALMLAHNAVGRLALYRRGWADSAGGFRPGLDGQEEYDLILRGAAVTESLRVVHVPRVLYHRAVPHAAASAQAWQAGRESIEHYLAVRRLRGTVKKAGEDEYQVDYSVPLPAPRVSILVPTTGRPELLEPCLRSVLDHSSYQDLEVLVLVSEAQRAYRDRSELVERISASPRVRVLAYPERPFNYSWVNNFGAGEATGEILCFLNDDVRAISPDWLEKLVARVSMPGVAAAGAMLYYPDETIQHAGIILGIEGFAGHACHREPRGGRGYLGRASLEQDVSGVTAACMVVRRSVFRDIGGFDEKFAIAFNDVDLCLRIRRAGWRIIWTPTAELYHLESASIGNHRAQARRTEFESEANLLRKRWGPLLDDDPFYNPNLSLHRQFALAFPPRVRL
jgi:GT2 family glycosyltransferase